MGTRFDFEWFASVTVKPIKIIMKRPLAGMRWLWLANWQGGLVCCLVMKKNKNSIFVVSCPSGSVIENHKLIVVVDVCLLYRCVASVSFSSWVFVYMSVTGRNLLETRGRDEEDDEKVIYLNVSLFIKCLSCDFIFIRFRFCNKLRYCPMRRYSPHWCWGYWRNTSNSRILWASYLLPRKNSDDWIF